MSPIPGTFPRAAAGGARILVVGDVMLDRYWFGSVDRISPEAPVPIVRVSRREDRLGGAANVARNVAALGAHACLMGVVGDDEPGRRVAGLAGEAGVQAALLVDPALPTTLKMRVLGRQQQLLRVDFEEEAHEGCRDRLAERVGGCLADYDLLVLSDYAKGTLASAEALIALARAAGVPVIVDPKGRHYERYRGASIITPNRLEMQEAVGAWRSEEELEGKAQALRRQLSLEALLVTRSEQGMTLFTDAGREQFDAHAQEVFDVSGAGDTVVATLAVTRAAGLDWTHAVNLANRAGGVVVGKLGTSVVTAEELE